MMKPKCGEGGMRLYSAVEEEDTVSNGKDTVRDEEGYKYTHTVRWCNYIVR